MPASRERPRRSSAPGGSRSSFPTHGTPGPRGVLEALRIQGAGHHEQRLCVHARPARRRRDARRGRRAREALSEAQFPAGRSRPRAAQAPPPRTPGAGDHPGSRGRRRRQLDRGLGVRLGHLRAEPRGRAGDGSRRGGPVRSTSVHIHGARGEPHPQETPTSMTIRPAPGPLLQVALQVEGEHSFSSMPSTTTSVTSELALWSSVPVLSIVPPCRSGPMTPGRSRS